MTTEPKTETAAHTPEPEIAVKYASTSGESCFYAVKGSQLPPYPTAERLQACHNACIGLSTEQVAGIPKTVAVLREAEPVLEMLSGLGGDVLESLPTIPAKLRAFDAMRVALDAIAIEMQSGDFPAAAMLKKMARAALALADEASK